ncbi:hypothetical protein niasHS_011995 [Heterodera schachtii]|uniref:Integrase catalytic domain-containing protein n=1 Tax=Heterodera schachtii TaxID=97005 RepID=A0ABD2IH21_HETSC
MDSLKEHNDGYRYILVCIDVLSRHIYVAEAESKKSEHMIEAFEKVFKKAQVLPNKMYSDSGLEFQAKRMNEYWRSKDIIKHVMYSPHLHAGVDEDDFVNIKLLNPDYKPDGTGPTTVTLKVKRAAAASADKELEPETRPEPDKELTREVPSSKTLDKELIREASLPATHDIELQRGDEPKPAEKELGRETGPAQLSDKQLGELEGENPQKEQLPATPIVDHGKISTIDQERMDLAKRVTEQSWKETVKLAANAADITEKAKTALNRAEQARKRAPNAPHVKKWFDRLSNMENNLRELVEKISQESKKAAEAKRKLDVHYDSKNLNECRKHADMSKQALKNSKNYIAQLTPMYFTTLPEDQLGVNELANRVVTAVNNFLNTELTVPRPVEDPQLPAGQPKQQQEKQMEKLKPTVEKEVGSIIKPPVPKLSDETETKREPTKPTVEKEMEREPVKQPEKELERESLKKADKELEPMVKQQSTQEDNLLEKAKKEIDQTAQNAALKAEYIRTLVANSKHNKGVAEVKEKEEEEAKKGAAINIQQEKKLEKEIPQVLKELEREKSQHDINTTAENTETEFPSSEYEIDDSSEKQPERTEQQAEVSYVFKKKEGKLEEEKIETKDDTAINEFPSTEYGIEESETEEIEKWSPDQAKQKILKGKEEPFEQPDGQKDEETILVIEEQLASTVPEEDIPKSEPYDVDELPDLPDPQALSAKGRGGSGVQHVDASNHLAYVLGFENTRLYYNHPAKYLPDLSGGVRQLYVYAPKLVEDTIIGDRMAPLLRVVNVSGTGPLDVPEPHSKQEEANSSILSVRATNVEEVCCTIASKEGIAAGTRVLGDLSQDSQYCDLSKTYMYLLTSIERKNGAGEWVPTDDAIEQDKHVGVIQNFGSSFVRSLKVNVSGVEVFDSSIYYHYRAYIMQELGYSHEIRKAFHEAGCYYSDENSQDSYSNKGFTSRAQRFSNGKQCETMVKLNFDLARQNTLLLNNQDVVFTIHRNSDSFLLLTPKWKTVTDAVKDAQGNIITAARVTWHDNTAEYRIRLHDMRLYVRTVDVTPSLNIAISRQLESTPAKYALRKVEMRSIFLGTGRTELSHNVFTSTLPRRLICAFVSTDAYSGARQLSPFNFEHANVRSISAEANGLTFPSTPYLFSFGNQKKFVRAFVDMYAGLGLDDSDNKTVSISMARFLSGWAFFVIPMTSTLDDTPGFELIRQGTCTVKVQFEEPIKADGYEMLILGEFDSVLSINADRVLSTDGIPCVHLVNAVYENQPVIVEGTLDLIDDLLFSTCYPKKRQGIEWSEPLYVELTDLMVCPGDLRKCLSHFGPRKNQRNLIVDELDWHDDDDDDISERAW